MYADLLDGMEINMNRSIKKISILASYMAEKKTKHCRYVEPNAICKDDTSDAQVTDETMNPFVQVLVEGTTTEGGITSVPQDTNNELMKPSVDGQEDAE